MSFSENIRILKTLTPGKIANAIRLKRSYAKALRTGVAETTAFPLSISFEPTTSCNLRCPECPSGLRSFTRPTGMLDEQLFRKTIDEISNELVFLTFYFQGEPYLNPAFLDMAAYAVKKNIYTGTSTNAHFITDESARKTVESGMQRLIISIDGATQKSYEQYRVGGNLQKVIEGTKKIIEWKKKLKSSTPYVIFQFLVVKPNEHETEKVKQLGKELGVDEVKFKTAQVYDFENGNPLIPTQEKFSRYAKTADGKWKIKNKLLNQCWRMWSSSVITWDGIVVPCCFDKDAKHRLGNVSENSFREIWRSSSYNRFRTLLLKSRSEIDICKNCSEGTKVWENTD